MFNLDNYGVTTGRLTTDPQFYDNSDGSRKVRLTVAATNIYKDSDGNRSAQFLPLEAFLPKRKAKNGNHVFDMMHQGDKVMIQYTVKNNNYERENEDGSKEMVYGLVLQIETVKLLETKATTAARLATRNGTEAEEPKAETRRNTKSSGKKAAA